MKKSTLRISLIISLLLHFTFMGLLWIDPFHFETPKNKEKMEIEIVDAQELLKQIKISEDKDLQGQIVEQDENALNDERDPNAKYLSKHNQKVEKETRAALQDKFKNSAVPLPQVAKPESKPSNEEMKAKQLDSKETKEALSDSRDNTEAPEDRKILTSENGIKTKPTLSDLRPSFKPRLEDTNIPQGGDGPSSSDDHLKEVATGMQTMLSTREFVYYTYYNRIKDRLRQYWEPKIKEKMERIMRQGRTIASVDRVTKIIITLDTAGLLVKVQVVGASGVEDLDQAAVEAFRAAAPFPNPPKGIVEDDGKIRIRWDFILEANNDTIDLNDQIASAQYD